MDAEVPHVVFDASVLFPFQTSHLLAFMAQSRVVRARWTRDIQREWVERSLEKYTGLRRESIEGRRDAMDRAMPDALVTGYQHRMHGMAFPDPDDRHVVAAALECGATMIVTRDKKHFNRQTLAPFALVPVDPDDLLCARLDDLPEIVQEVVDRARTALSKTKPDLDAYLDLLDKTGLNAFAARLRTSVPTP